MNLSEYILLPREQRVAHVDLTTPCVDATVKGKNGNRRARKDLIKHLSLLDDKVGVRAQCCHLCGRNSSAEVVCVNPQHIYFGTPKENINDKPPEVRSNALRKTWAKLTPEERSQRSLKGITLRAQSCREAALKRWANKTQEERRANTKAATDSRRKKT